MAKFMKNDACCKQQPGDDPGGQDCLSKWKADLEQVSNEYNIAKAKTAKDKEAYVNSLAWATKVRNWNDLIIKTDEMAKAVVSELDFILAQIKIVCDKASCTNDALEKLICLVKQIFDAFVTYDKNKAGLKDRIADLKKEINCLQKVTEQAKAEGLKCLENYEQKIEKVCKLQDEVLSKLLETLKATRLLYAAICSEGGLQHKLVGIRMDFAGTTPETEEHCDSSYQKDTGPTTSDPNKYPCDDSKVVSVPEFPISEGEYYKGLKKDLDTATARTLELQTTWMNSKKESDSKLSRKTGLEEAIKAAKAAENGK